MKNVHNLLAKLSWNFSAEQLDHLFHCFQVLCDLLFVVFWFIVDV